MITKSGHRGLMKGLKVRRLSIPKYSLTLKGIRLSDQGTS